MGLIYTTFKLYEKLNLLEIDNILICEDDILLHKDYCHNSLSNIIYNREFDFIYIGYNNISKDICKKYKNKSVNIYALPDTDTESWFYGTYGYVCNKKFRKYVLDLGIEWFINNNFALDLGFNYIRFSHLKNSLKFGILSGEQMIIPYVLDSNCLQGRRDKSFYEKKYIILEKYNFNKIYNQTTKFVFIIPSFNNEKWIKNNLQSIINQNYSNWSVIYINDNSNDKTHNLFNEIISNANNVSDKFFYIKNDKTYKQAYNRYMAYNMCCDDDICILLDGDDWLYSPFVLNYLNTFMTHHNIDITYRNFKYYNNNKISNGYTVKDYSDEIKKTKYYRNDIWRAGHLRVIKAIYLKKINVFDLLDLNNDFIQCCTDLVESFSSLELSNGKHKICDENLMIYNKQNSKKYNTSEYNVYNKEYRQIIEKRVKTIPPYLNSLRKNNLVLLNIENENYKINLNKYSHELQDYADLLLINSKHIDLYKNKYNNYDNFLYIDDYTNISLNPQKNNLFTKTIQKNNLNYKKENMLLTIAIPCYNVFEMIEDTLDSLNNQTDKKFNVIIIDDKSTDNTIEKIESILHKYNFNYSFYKNDVNLGYARTIGKCIGLSDTSYISTLDSDDSLELNAVEIINNVLKNNNPSEYGFLYTNFNYCDENLKKIHIGFCKAINDGETNLEKNCVSQLRIFHKYTYYKTRGYIENDLFKKGAEDKDIYFKMEEVTKLKFIDNALYNYRKNNNSMSKINTTNQKIEFKSNDICKNNFELAKKLAIERRIETKIIEDFYKYNI